MPAPISRPLLALILVAWTASQCSGQHGHGLGHAPLQGHGHLGGYYEPFFGFGQPVSGWAVQHPQGVWGVAHPHPQPYSSVGAFGFSSGFFGGVPSWSGYSFFGGAASFLPATTLPMPGLAGPGGLWLASPPATSAAASPAPRSRTNLARASELVELGDRAFRGGNYRKAEERYHLAIKADGAATLAYVRLAQVDLIRSSYLKAAAHFREAVEAGEGRGWLLDTPDVQSLYGEPREFARRIAQLESYLQAHPEDRDAWFVLGAERYLSGHPREANDAFVRLADRPADPALTAFQDAATVSMRSIARGDAADRDDP